MEQSVGATTEQKDTHCIQCLLQPGMHSLCCHRQHASGTLPFSCWPAVPHAAASELPAVLLELATPLDRSLCAPVDTCSSACRQLATEVMPD